MGISTPETEAKWVMEAVMDRIRAELRAQIMEKIEPSIQAAVDKVARELEVHAAKHMDHMLGQSIIKVMLVNKKEST